MTSLSTLEGQRQPSRLKNLRGAVINVWLGGQHDTVDLARRFHITEAEAYRIISGRALPTSNNHRIPYAGAAR